MEAPLVLLALDEVGTLIDLSRTGGDPSCYTTAMITLRTENIPGVMVTVLSSYANFGDILPLTSDKYKQHQETFGDEKIDLRTQPPFVEFNFDIFAQPIRKGNVELERACTPEFLAHYGRPL